MGAETHESPPVLVKRLNRGLTGCHSHRQVSEQGLLRHQFLMDAQPVLDCFIHTLIMRRSRPHAHELQPRVSAPVGTLINSD